MLSLTHAMLKARIQGETLFGAQGLIAAVKKAGTRTPKEIARFVAVDAVENQPPIVELKRGTIVVA